MDSLRGIAAGLIAALGGGLIVIGSILLWVSGQRPEPTYFGPSAMRYLVDHQVLHYRYFGSDREDDIHVG